MQRIYVLALPLVCFLMLLPVSAQDSSGFHEKIRDSGVPASVTVSLPNVSKPAATISTAEIQIPINISDVTGMGINALQFNVLFNENVLDFWNVTGCTVSGTIADDVGIGATCNATVPGILRVSMSGAFPLVGSGTVLYMRVRADPSTNGGEGTALTFQDLALFSPTFPSLPGVPKTEVNGSVLLFGPTAANASVAGRITTPDGVGIARARVRLVGTEGEEWTALTNGFGYFRMEGIPVGQTYVLSVLSKQYTFQSVALTVNEDLSDIVIVSEN